MEPPINETLTLAEMGITKRRSSQWQMRLTDIPDGIFHIGTRNVDIKGTRQDANQLISWPESYYYNYTQYIRLVNGRRYRHLDL